MLVDQLTPAAFYNTVLAAKPRTAVFDCDGTLWNGDAGYEFMVWSLESGFVSTERAAWMRERYGLYRAGQLSEADTCGEMVQLYAGMPESEVRHAARSFADAYLPGRNFPEMEHLVAALREADCTIWAVSSTSHWVIEEGVRVFGIPPERILASRVRVAKGIVTDELLDVPTDGGKAASLRRAGLPAPDCVFGNSIHDAAMLSLAQHAFAVNPTPALVATAAEQNWPLFYPAAVVRNAH